MSRFALLTLCLLANVAAHASELPGTAKGGPGETIYRTVCAGCHDQGAGRAPQLEALTLLSPRSIYRALTEGVMKPQGAALSDRDKIDVAEFITDSKLGATSKSLEPPRCKGQARAFDSHEAPVFSGWGMGAENRRFIPTAKAGIDKSNVGRLHLAWAVAFPDTSRVRSEPALGWGALFVGSHNGGVYALDRKSGCLRWRYQAGGEVRSGIVLSEKGFVYFGDSLGNVYALNAHDGTLVWRLRADPHPSTTITGTPALYAGVLYVPVSSLEEFRAADPRYECCSFRGSILALDAATGAQKWRSSSIFEPLAPQGKTAKGVAQFGPSGAAVWNSPAIDVKRRRLYFATGDNYSAPADRTSDAVIALDLDDGKMAWVSQVSPNDVWNVSCILGDGMNCPKNAGLDHDFGAAVIMDHSPDCPDLLFAGQKSGAVYALDPDTGKVRWTAKLGGGGASGGVLFGMASNGRALFVPMNDRFGPKNDKHPGMYALEAASGRLLWSVPAQAKRCGDRKFCDPGFSQAITATPDLVFAGSGDGWLQIHDAATGAVLWHYDTTQPVVGVGGAKGAGGSMSGGAGPIAYDGMLFVSSGYGFGNIMPGNVLLAFSVK